MSAPDTSAEAVMHLVGMLPDWRGEAPSDALDAALFEAAALTALCAARPDVAALLSGEAVAVPRELLDGLASEAEAAINEACCVRDFKPHPALERRYERDMQDVREARRLLAASPWAQEAARDEQS